MFLTQQELADFTGYTKPSAQIRWLKARLAKGSIRQVYRTA